MTINDSQRDALRRLRDAKTPLTHRHRVTNPEGLHHKTLEGLAVRFLIEPRGVGYVITKAGLTALEGAATRRTRSTRGS